MPGRHGRWVVGLAAVAVVAALAWWSTANAWRAYRIADFEAHDVATHQVRTPLVDRHGFGPLEVHVVDLPDADTAIVPADGEPYEPGWPWPWFEVNRHGARYASHPPTDGAWIPFAAAAAGGLVLAGVIAWRSRRWIVAAYDGAAFVLFGQDDPATRRFGWLPGHGGRGLGGQVPPHVPYSPEWDDRDHRIRP